MNEKPDMMVNIYGGNNLIAPVASSAIQNFYGDRILRKRRVQKV